MGEKKPKKRKLRNIVLVLRDCNEQCTGNELMRSEDNARPRIVAKIFQKKTKKDTVPAVLQTDLALLVRYHSIPVDEI